MTTEKLNEAKNLEMHIKSLKNDLKDISIYEKNAYSRAIGIKLPCDYDTERMFTLTLFDKQLKKDILNTIKIHLIAEIQKTEKELEEL